MLKISAFFFGVALGCLMTDAKAAPIHIEAPMTTAAQMICPAGTVPPDRLKLLFMQFTAEQRADGATVDQAQERLVILGQAYAEIARREGTVNLLCVTAREVGK